LYYDTDIAFLNSGCIRNDVILPQGPIKLSKLTNIIEDLVIVKLVPGSVVFKMLESAVRGLPHSFMGSFLLISGIKFKYDLNKTPRVQEVERNSEPIEMDKMYTVGMPAYMGNGADGYEFVKPYTKIIDEARAVSVITLLLKFFEGADAKLEPRDENEDENYNLDKFRSARLDRIKTLRSRFIEMEGREKLVCINPSTDQRIVCLNSSN
jgi:2',3'-cyclic-nucleotide 2'-phosphodiesterase (5'-nucleotidase family)